MPAKKRLLALLILIYASHSLGETSSDTIPTLGNSSSNLVSVEQERLLGKAWLRKLKKHTNSYENPIVNEYLTSLIYKLAPNSGVIDRNFTSTIIDNPTLNAFAVPGSIIGVNAGLFFQTSSEQEFASVIAHELAHLSQRHYARMLERQRLSGPLTLAGFLTSVIIAAAAGSDAGVAALASAQALSADQQLRFSRKNEQEADRLGIQIMESSNFDPRAMPSMFERMYKQTRLRAESLPEYLSTHPLSETRIADTRGRAEQYSPKAYQDDIEFHFSRNMIIADYAESKQTAIDYFSNIIEKGKTRQTVAARFGLAYAYLEQEPDKALEILTALRTKTASNVSINTLYAKALSNLSQHDKAISLLENQLSRNSNNYPTACALAEAYLKANKIRESEQTLFQLTKLHPEDTALWYQLAEASGLAGNITQLHQARAEYFFLTDRLPEAIEQLSLALKKNTNEFQEIRIQTRLDRFYELERKPLL